MPPRLHRRFWTVAGLLFRLQRRFSVVLLCGGLVFGHFALFPPLPSHAGEFRVQPSIAISEEYSDNVNQTREKVSAFTTKVTPNIAATYTAPFWDWNLNYNLEYRHYSEEVILDTGDTGQNDFRHTLNVRGLTRLIDNLMYLDVHNVFERTDLNVVRRSTVPQFLDAPSNGVDAQDIPALNGDAPDRMDEALVFEDIRNRESTDRNTFSISPYFAFDPTDRTSLGTGYRYTNIWYRDDSADNSEEHHTFARAEYRLTRAWGLNAGYSSTWKRWDDEDGVDQENVHNVYGGSSYTYGPESRVYGDFGITWRQRDRVDVQGRETSTDPFVRAGFQHRLTEATSIFGEVTTPITPTRGDTDTTDLTWNAGVRQLIGRYIATFITTVRYIDDPLRETTRQETVYALGVVRPYGRGSVSLSTSYSEFDQPKETKTAATLALTHSLTQRLTANAGLGAERRSPEDNARIDEWRTFLGFRYLLSPTLQASLFYRYFDSSSKDPLSDDNFQENRVTLELRKEF
ncbi:MAG: hypothetical protein EA399_11315 [Desulfovibrionales bacterium]|nr:MAG: hypothetical protein EA399_11315 [Desulfovibrionales bacterium]